MNGLNISGFTLKVGLCFVKFQTLKLKAKGCLDILKFRIDLMI